MNEALERVIAGSRRMPNGCRVWRGAKCRDYGEISVGGRMHRAHRVAYEAVRGPVPAGLVLDHLICDDPSCNDEWHVEPSTQRDNTLRSETSPSAINARKTRCIHGHPFDEANTYITTKGKRECRTCMRRHQAAHRARRRKEKTA